MALTFDQERHEYTLDQVVVPSVTQVLRASGLIDFSGIPEGILEAAQRRGTIVHQAAHYYNEHDLDVGEFIGNYPKYAPYLLSWIALMESGRLQTHFCEYRVASRKHRYAGTIDWLGEFDGHGALIDFATGDPDDCAKHYQTAGYLTAALEWQDQDPRLAAFFAEHPVVRRYSVRLKKDGKLPTPHPYKDPRDHARFLTLVGARRIVEEERGALKAWTDAWMTEAA